MKVTIEPHNPAWASEFSKDKQSLERILKDIPYVSIEHVGSTSIPGLSAKPVIDIDIIIKLEDLAATRQALSGTGYFDCGEVGVPGRFQFRQPGFGLRDAAWGVHGTEMRRNTYAMIEGCAALRNHLDIKRMLLADQDLREEYGDVKKELAGREYNSMGEYARAKNEMLWTILRKAGWTEKDLEPIIRANTDNSHDVLVEKV